MKNLFILLFLATLSNSVFAQSPDKVLARVRYTYSNQLDTLKNGKTRTENMVLFAGKKASLFTSLDRIIFNISIEQNLYQKSLSRISSSSKPTVVRIDRSMGDWLSKIDYLIFYEKKKMFTKEIIANFSFLAKEDIPVLQWKIAKDTISIAGVFCLKATTIIDGKIWEVWFAPSLPFQSGPWKLQGLPGLIIEAQNERKNTTYKFAGIENEKDGKFIRRKDVKKGPNYEVGDISNIDVLMGIDVAAAYYDNKILLPTFRAKIASKSEIEKLRDAFAKDPKGISNAIWGGGY